ncbi:hypothetical protein [Pseudomonas sp. HY7a-MNA-CIBAN-0227]|uniref:hypothetical protein n=1 Tax=Pseudomonas sp. HY7a-MNA-CIBAN-0227 TaxID=3140474 RepID=UPI0033184F76
MTRTFSLPTFNQFSEPDSHPFKTNTADLKIRLPGEDFVISRDEQGNITSRLTDMTWELGSYAQTTRSYTSINFDTNIKNLNSELIDQHRLLLLLILHPPQGFNNNLSVNTIIRRHSLLSKAAKYSLLHDISIYNIFSSHEWFVPFAITLSKRLKEELYALGRWLYKLGNILPFTSVKPPKKITKRKNRSTYSQTPVIPQRIYTDILTELVRKTSEFESRWSLIRSFMSKRQETPSFATSRSRSRNKQSDLSNFEAEATAHGLREYLLNCGVKSTNQLGRLLSEIQYSCKLLIHAYSGMRDDEAYSLGINPISYELIDGNNVTWVIGTTTKLEKGRKKTQWIIGAPGVKACKIAADISEFIYTYSAIVSATEEKMLFPNVSALSHGKFAKNSDSRIVPADLVHVKFAKFLRSDETVISEADLQDLYLTEIGRDWANERKLAVGKHWHFTSHQFRRSLAYYAIDGGLVQLTSLKRQLQHLSLLMTIYYAKGFTQYGSFFGDDPDHFRYEYHECKPTVQALTYFRDVFQSTVNLSGGHGTWIENFIKSQGPVKVAAKKEETLESFKRGEIFFVSRPTGGCTKPSCNLWIIDPIAACSFKGCANSVINPLKMRKALFIYEQFTTELTLNSPERLTAELILSQAEKYFSKISADGVIQ